MFQTSTGEVLKAMFEFCIHLILVGVVRPQQALNANNIEFKLNQDYIYEIFPNQPERYFNPNSVTIVRDIGFLQIESSLRALKLLGSNLEQTCQEIEKIEREGALNYDYEFVKGKFNQSSAKAACSARGKKLIELQSSDQLLVLLQKLNGKYTVSPSGTTF